MLLQMDNADMQPSLEQNFATQIRPAREAASMTQADLAKRLRNYGVDIDPSGIARMEQGRRSVRLNEAFGLSQILGIPLADMIQPPVLRGMSLAAARKELAKLMAQAEELDRDADEARMKAGDAEREADSLDYHRREVRRLVNLLEDYIERGGTE